jgi:hypothetical protein
VLFDSARGGLSCALAIQRELAARADGIRVRIVLNAGARFRDRGRVALKGFPEHQRLYELSQAAPPAAARRDTGCNPGCKLSATEANSSNSNRLRALNPSGCAWIAPAGGRAVAGSNPVSPITISLQSA